MKRWEHTLKRNAGSARPQNILFWDTESWIIKREIFTALPLRLWAAIYQRTSSGTQKRKSKTYVGKTTDDFVALLESLSRRRTTLYILAHNLKHDLGCSDLIPALVERGWVLKFLYEKSTTVIVRLVKDDRKLCFLDSMNYFTTSLDDLARLVGMEKLEVDFESAGEEKILEHCVRDCEILQQIFNAYIAFLDSGNYGNWKTTKAAQAFSIYRHQFMSTPIKIHENQEALEMERGAYGGGLVRCYRVGHFTDDTYTQLDVNSMYPFVMHEFDYPIRLLGIRRRCTPEQLDEVIQRRCVIAELTVQPTRAIYRHQTEKYITYPLYKFTGFFSTPEVRALLDENAIVQVHRVAVYTRSRIFKEYVEHFYDLRLQYRQERNFVYERFVKDLLNSLYGKFGSRTGGLEPYPWPGELHGDEFLVIRPDERGIYFIYWIAGQPYIHTTEEEAYNSFPAIAAHVTAYGRMYLQYLAMIAGLENVFYSDTDSLIVNSAGLSHLRSYIRPNELGYLKIERVANELQIYARKDYKIGTKRVLKGVPNHQRAGDGNEYFRDVWPGLTARWGAKRYSDYGVTTQKIVLVRPIYDGKITSAGFVIPFTSPLEMPPLDQ